MKELKQKMMKKNYSICFVFCLVLYFSFCCQLPAGQIKLIKQVSLDDLGILKPTLIKVHLGNTYIFDEAEMSFFIINNEFKVIKKFGKSGFGPEEYQKPVEFGFFNDMMWLTDSYGKMIRYDLNGKFCEEKKALANNSFVIEQTDADRYFLIENRLGDPKNTLRSLSFVTKAEKIKVFEMKEPFQLTLDFESKLNFLFAITKNSCYVVPSDKQYYIRRFDINKKITAEEIEKKDSQRIKYTEKEITEFNKRIKKIGASISGYQLLNIKPPVLKPAVKQIYADEKDRVYVICPSTQECKYSLEIYDKTFKYLDSYIIPATGLFFPTSDFIYLVTSDDEKDTYWLQLYTLNSFQ